MKDLHVLGNSVAIIGRKRIGKNYFASKLAKALYENGVEDLKELSIAYFLKTNSYVPQGFENDDFDYGYLKDDLKYFVEHSDEFVFDEGDPRDCGFSDSIMEKVFSGLPDFGYSQLSDSEKFELIEFFKTKDSMKTRFALQRFGDYVKDKTNDPFVLSTKLLSSIKKSRYAPILGYVNTDTRFVTELIDFLIEGFYVVSLENSDLEIERPYMEHVSEIELGMSPIKAGIVVDLKGPQDGVVIDGIRRMRQEDFDEKVRSIIPHMLSFSGYSKKDLDALKDLKEKLKKGYLGFFKKQSTLMEAYARMKSGKMSDGEFEIFVESYREYDSVRNVLMNEINGIISKYY